MYAIPQLPLLTDLLKRLPLARAARRQVVLHHRTFLAPTAALRGS